MFRHGYYIPAQNALGGDAALAREAQAFFSERLGLDAEFAARYDGVSIFTRPDGSTIIRVTLQNFFTESIDIKTFDYPYRGSPLQGRTCGECGGVIKLLPAGDGDFRIIRKSGHIVQVPIPSHILIPKCEYCGEHYFGQTDADRVAEALGADPCSYTSSSTNQAAGAS